MMPQLWKIKQPYNVSVTAGEAALVSLRHVELLRQRCGWIRSERVRLYHALQDIEWLEPYPSESNFILVRVLRKNAREVKQQLAEKGMLVRYFNKPGLEDHIRISVGKPEHTDRLLEVLEEVEEES
jgi:histidinol-phosphate aminotransferase